MKDTYARAVSRLRPGAQFVMRNTRDLATLDWKDARPRPTNEEIEAELKKGPAKTVDPLDKLRAFLAANPDIVAALDNG